MLLQLQLLTRQLLFFRYITDGTTNTNPTYVYPVTSSASSTNGSYYPGNAFDGSTGNINVFWWAGGYCPQWIQADFGSSPKCINTFRYFSLNIYYTNPTQFTLQASNIDGSGYIDLYTGSIEGLPVLNAWSPLYGFSNNTVYRYYRLYIHHTYYDGNWPAINELQLGEAQHY